MSVTNPADAAGLQIARTTVSDRALLPVVDALPSVTSDALPRTPVADRPLGVRPCSIVLLDADRAHSQRIEKVLRSMVPDVRVAMSLDAVRCDGAIDLLVVNYESFDGAALEATFARFPREGTPRRLLIHSGGTSRGELGVLFSRYGLTNLLARADAEGAELFVTVQKILHGDIFGLEKYFPIGTQAVKATLRDSADRFALLDQFADLAGKLGVPPRFIQHMSTVADEMTTNALYDAPVDAEGRHRFASLSRSVDVCLDAGEEIHTTFCCDGRRLGISVADPFGSLHAACVLAYLTKCFRVGEDQIDHKDGGAGLGLYMAFEALSHFVINLRPGRSTEMIGLVDIRGTYKDFALRGKSFNIFVAE